ncbi:MAG TPA: YciI family protein [Cyclobacteriaceae bacterium]|nr:YciI family protein [Cyclobacteriaceae bacterium]
MRSIVALLLVLVTFTESRSQEKYTFVFLHKRTDAPQLSKEESDKIMSGHMGNMEKLAKEGKLMAAGPFEGGGGIFIFKSTSTSEVTEWISPDPGVQAKRWNIEMLPYEPKIGGICPVGEKYEMIMYTFIHFKPKVFKFNVQEAGQTVEEHNKFVKELSKGGNVVTHASFGGIDGAILIMKGDVQQEAILEDPAVKGALFEPEFKKLYIAKGSFCEK